jgi:hypothetical protein
MSAAAALREHFTLDQPHISVGVKQIRLLISRSRTNCEPWILWVVGIEQHQSEAEHLAKGIEARDLVIRRFVRDDQIDFVAE